MPVYEFRCAACGARFATLVGMTSDDGDVGCPKCGSVTVNKLISRFTRGRDEDARVDELADRLEITGEPESSRQARQLMRDMGESLDEDMSDAMEEMFESDMEGGLDE